MSSLYAKYIREREGKEIIETEWGFVTYKIIGKEIYLADMYLTHEERNLGLASGLVKMLIDIGIKNECEVLTANVHLADKNANDTLSKALHLGFELAGANNGVILIAKKLIGGV